MNTLALLISTSSVHRIITVKPRQNGGHFANAFSNSCYSKAIDIFRFKFHWTWFPRVKSTNEAEMVQIVAWRQTGDKPLSEPMRGWFIAAYIRHPASMNFHYIKRYLAGTFIVIHQFISNFSLTSYKTPLRGMELNKQNATAHGVELSHVATKSIDALRFLLVSGHFKRIWNNKDTTIMVQTACAMRLKEISVDYITIDNSLYPCTI